MSENRLSESFAQLKEHGRKAFVVYLCAGDPHIDQTVELVIGMAAAGADVIELGIPYSDPMADGPANQAASERALAAGTKLSQVLEAVRRIRERTQVPLIFFTYLGPLMQYGYADFARDARAAGVDGVLPLDLPPEEDDGLIAALRAEGLANVHLVAPNTLPSRREQLAQNSRGFLYYVCRYGVTGERSGLPEDLRDQIAHLKSLSDIPICIGFGISTPEQAAEAAQAGDGVIVGSHLVRLIEKHGDDADLVERVCARVGELAAAIHA